MQKLYPFILSLLIICPANLSAFELIDPKVEASAGYRQEKTVDFEQENATFRLLQLSVHLVAKMRDYPVSLAYFFKAPIADLGSDDIGITEGFSFSNGIAARYWLTDLLPEYEPYLSVGYEFYGLSSLKAKSRVTGEDASGQEVKLPETDIEMRTKSTGFHFDLGARYPIKESGSIIFGLSREIFKKQVELFNFYGIDQKHLVTKSIHNTTYNANKLFCGYRWDF